MAFHDDRVESQRMLSSVEAEIEDRLNDPRLQRLISAVAHETISGLKASETNRSGLQDATIAATGSMLATIYREDVYIRKLRAERDHYKKLTERTVQRSSSKSRVTRKQEPG